LCRVLGQQRLEQRIGGRQLAAKRLCRFYQSSTDAVAQFPGGRIGKGDDKNFRRQQLALETGLVATVAQHQPQIERRDGEGLAGAGAGLDQAAAAQREAQRQGQSLVAHAGSSMSCTRVISWSRQASSSG